MTSSDIEEIFLSGNIYFGTPERSCENKRTPEGNHINLGKKFTFKKTFFTGILWN